MSYIIGLDFGNNYSQLFFIERLDSETKLGGDVHRLMPYDGYQPRGIPSVYFYSDIRGVKLGFDAVSSRAIPVDNRVGCLKRRLDQSVTLDGKTIAINDMITEVIQYCIRIANEVLLNDFGLTTNQIAVAYPINCSTSDCLTLVNLAEKATLEDGTPVEVVGMIAEPAAAALDYLAANYQIDKDATVLTYDLGGTFDLTLVAAYPRGHRNPMGGLYYYDIIDECGMSDLGGVDFDEAMFEILKQKVEDALNGDSLTAREEETLRSECEEAKIELSSYEYTTIDVTHNDISLDIWISRQEFEAKIKPILMKTIALTKKILAENPKYKPDYIVLAGGSCEMPMVEAVLKEHLPEYADRIKKHRPTMSISCGAIRYGTKEAHKSKVCPNCQNRYIEGDKYCRYCGAPMGQPAYHYTAFNSFVAIYGPPAFNRNVGRHICMKCNHSWETKLGPEGTHFCPECGTDNNFEHRSKNNFENRPKKEKKRFWKKWW